MVTVDVAAAPFGVTEAGPNVQEANEGRPEHENVVAAANPLTGVMLTVDDAELPLATVALAGVSAMEKSGEPVTLSVTTFELDVALLASPAYVAVRLCDPTASELVVKVATSDVFSEPLPRVTAPSRNVTWPVGAGVSAVPVTVADSVTLVPKTLVAGPVRTVVVALGAGAMTVSDAVALVSPGLVTEMEYAPAADSTVLLRSKLAMPATPVTV